MSDKGSVPAPSTSGQKVIREEVIDERPCFFRFVSAITRTWGLLTLIGLWYCTVELIIENDKTVYLQWYNLAVSIVVTFFEVVWIFPKLCRCQDDGQCCCTCWRIILWIDNWRKTILYIGVSIVEFIFEPFTKYALVTGILLIVLGILYFLKSIKDSKCIQKKKIKRTTYHEGPSASDEQNEGSPLVSSQQSYTLDENERNNSASKKNKPESTNPFDED